MTEEQIEVAKKLGLGIRADVQSFRYINHEKGLIIDIYAKKM
jgi:hypothetical protein